MAGQPLAWRYCPACRSLSRSASRCRWCGDHGTVPAGLSDTEWRAKGVRTLLASPDLMMVHTLVKDGRHHAH